MRPFIERRATLVRHVAMTLADPPIGVTGRMRIRRLELFDLAAPGWRRAVYYPASRATLLLPGEVTVALGDLYPWSTLDDA